MSTSHTAKIYITNNTGGDAFIQMSHRYSGKKPEAASWMVKTGDTAGPLTVTFETGVGTGFDHWYCSATVMNGLHAGIYASSGSLLDPGKECMLKASDAVGTITHVITEDTFHINLPSGKCSTPMNLLAPYSKITNVFVLMLENHSFDHLFGFSGIDDVRGLTGKESNAFNGTVYKTREPAIDPMPVGPGHEFLHTLEQLCGAGTENPFPAGPYPPIDNSGFVASYSAEGAGSKDEGDVMHCCTSSTQIPMLYKLARNFTLCDNWFSSMPGPTWPNRLFAMGGSSAGLDDSPSSSDITEWETVDGFKYPNGSIFDQLKSAGHQFRLYNDMANEFCWWGPDYSMGKLPIVLGLNGIQITDVLSFGSFRADLQHKYPYEFTWIEPNYGRATVDFSGGSSQHPTDSLKAGEKMVAATYDAIRTSPYWATSMLIITYDEHGGYYDHVAPPSATPPDDNPGDKLNTHGFDFKRYGVRVPAVVVSPLTAKGVVSHEQFDHTSVLKTLERNWSFEPLTQRDATAADLLGLLTLSRPREDTPLTISTGGITFSSKSLPDGPDNGDPVSREPRPPQPDLAGLDARPLPERGNIIGFLHIALKCEVEMSDGSDIEKQAIIDNFKASVHTYGDADAYFKRIAAEIDAYRAAGQNIATA